MTHATGAGGGGCWLLVDDDEVFARTLANSLTRRGHRVQVAHSGPAALTCAADYTPDRVLLDLRLGTQSGLRVLPELRRIVPQARIVMLTAFGSIASAVQAVKDGADDYLLKPITVPDLLSAFGEPGAESLAPTTMSPRKLEWEYIQRVLAEEAGNVSRTAERLGMHRRTLQRKLEKKAPRN